MFSKVIALCVLVAVCGAIAPYGHEEHHYEHHVPPHYSFAYEVKDTHTGDIKSHHEERQGDHTQGVYSLIEPDGSKRTVEYLVEGKSGFNAKVHRDHNKHPIQHKPSHHLSGGYLHQPSLQISSGYHHQPSLHLSSGYNHNQGLLSHHSYQPQASHGHASSFSSFSSHHSAPSHHISGHHY